MYKVEQHFIKKNDKRWQIIDKASFLSKNLYNATLYMLRQEFFASGKTYSYYQLDLLLKKNADYCALPRKVSQLVLQQVVYDWQAFWAAIKAYNANPSKFNARPRLPKYKDSNTGRNLIIYNLQALSQIKLAKGLIAPSQLKIKIQTRIVPQSIRMVRIIPHRNHYVVEVVYDATKDVVALPPNRIAGIDIGLNNLAAVTSNQRGFRPLLVNGRPLKSINQAYNKERARLQSQLPTGQFTSNRIQNLTDKRNRQINHFLHVASRMLIDEFVRHGIGTLIIGKNDGWKQYIQLGKSTNQQFVDIPHARFIDMLSYKAEEQGISVIVTEECYTSKCSFLDNESIRKHETYSGKRIKRGLFQASDGRLLNADINGSANIVRKVIPNAFADGIEAIVVSPLRVTPA